MGQAVGRQCWMGKAVLKCSAAAASQVQPPTRQQYASEELIAKLRLPLVRVAMLAWSLCEREWYAW